MLFTAVLAMLSMLRPPLTGLLGYISSAGIALVTLHVGAKQGLQVTAGAMLGGMLMAYFVVGTPMLAIAFALLLWLPVWFLAVLLRSTRSLGITLQTAALLGVLGVLLTFLLVNDIVAVWQEVLQGIKPVLQQLEQVSDEKRLNQILAIYAWFMTGAIIALHIALGLIVPLLIGRGWQAALFKLIC